MIINPTLPTLFKKSSKGADQFWEISVDGSTIITRWGQVNGKTQETRDVITEGKNLGKKNETTPAQQALSEAQSQWEKKLKKGYVQSLNDAREGKVDDIIEGGIAPMLAHRFDEHGHKLKYPCLVQPKLDGHRCLAVVGEEGVTLWSRTRKPINSMPHIVKAVEALGLAIGTVLDGELYSHTHKDKFEELSSFIRSSQPKDGHEVIEYWVYDYIDNNNHPQQTRTMYLLPALSGDIKPLVCVPTFEATSEDEALAYFQGWLTDGFEGAIARNRDGLYVNKRSYDLLKIKEFQDAEFKVIGVEEGRGKLAGHAIFVCETAGGQFKAKMKGETAALKKYWDDPSLAVGRYLTVQYFGLTKDNIPRFPVALRFYEP